MVAARAGLKRFEGNPCPKCDGTIRHTSSGSCVRCTIKRATARTNEIRETLREAAKNEADS